MEKVDKYQKWLQLISKEVTDLSYSLDVWNTVIRVQNKSKHFKKYGRHLQHWLTQNYTYRMIIQIGKITEPKEYKKDDKNFIKLLKKLKQDNYISFEKFLKTYEKELSENKYGELVEEIDGVKIYELNFTINDAQNNFKKITGYTHKRKDYSIMIDKDIAIIENIFQTIKKLRHKKIAHLTNEDIQKVPTYEDIAKSVKLLQNITKKYYLILFNVHKTFHYYDLDVKTVFQKPWIE